MIHHYNYLKYLLIHKYYVFRGGLILGVNIWQLLIHDLSKFFPDEWSAYVDYFNVYAGKEKPQHIQEKFDLAWRKHQIRNKHHWQNYLAMELDLIIQHKDNTCQNQYKKQSSVKNVEYTGHDKISCMQINLEAYAKNIFRNIIDKITTKRLITNEHRTESITERIQLRETKRRRDMQQKRNRWFLNITATVHHVVHVAARHTWNFLRLTILTAAGSNIVKSIQRVLAVFGCIDGQSLITTRQYSEYYVTIVTRLMDFLGIARTTHLNDILVTDDGKIRCLHCGTGLSDINTYPLEMPEKYVKEMIADWYGAGYAKTGKNDVAEWWDKTRSTKILHKNTESLVGRIIRNYFRKW